MKILAVLLILISSFTSIAQLSGDLATQRKTVTDIAYTITGHKTGKFVFEIAVNMEGKVTSCVLLTDQSTMVSTPLMMKAKNQIIMGLTFERGYHFPEFHRGFVTITVLPEDNNRTPEK